MPATPPAQAYAELGALPGLSFLDGASHPAELVTVAAKFGLMETGICDGDNLTSVVRGPVMAKHFGLPSGAWEGLHT